MPFAWNGRVTREVWDDQGSWCELGAESEAGDAWTASGYVTPKKIERRKLYHALKF